MTPAHAAHSHDARATLVEGLAWTAGSLLAFGLSMLIVFPLDLAFDIPRPADLAVWSVSWGIGAVVGVVLAARLAFGGWPSVGIAAVAVAVVGIGLSAAVQLLLVAWMTDSLGTYDPEYAGLTAGLFAILVGLAAASFGVVVAPPGATAWPATLSVIGAGGVILAAASNVGALADGIRPESWPLAISIGLAVVYATAGGALALRALHFHR